MSGLTPNKTAALAPLPLYLACGRKKASEGDADMTKVIYEIVQHDGGWAYRVDGVYSETFPTHDAARAAADRAAGEQRVSGEAVGITYEDASGRWREEVDEGDDRPDTEVKG